MFYTPDQFKTTDDIHAELDRLRDEDEKYWIQLRKKRDEIDVRLTALINTGSAQIPDDVGLIPDDVIAIDPHKRCTQCHGSGMLVEDIDGSNVHSVCWACLGTGRDSVVRVA